MNTSHEYIVQIAALRTLEAKQCDKESTVEIYDTEGKKITILSQ